MKVRSEIEIALVILGSLLEVLHGFASVGIVTGGCLKDFSVVIEGGRVFGLDGHSLLEIVARHVEHVVVKGKDPVVPLHLSNQQDHLLLAGFKHATGAIRLLLFSSE